MSNLMRKESEPLRPKPILALMAGLCLCVAGRISLWADKPTLIRFGVSSAGVGNPPRTAAGWTSVAQLHRYLEKEFEADGIPVQWIFFKGQGPAVNEAIANNQLDFTSLGDLPSIVGRSAGLDTRLVLVSGSRADAYIAVPPDSPLKNVEDLRGKRVAFNKGTATQLLANRVLEKYGLQEKDIRVVNMEPANAKAAFLAGQVDAVFGTLDLVRLSSEGKARILWSSKKYPLAASAGHILVNQKFADRYPEHAYRVVKALLKAAHWAGEEANRDSVLKIWGSAGALPESLYRREFKDVRLSIRLSPIFDPYIQAVDRQSVSDAYRYKLIRKPFDVDAWIDRRYADAALKELKLEGFWPAFDKEGNRIQVN
jgi:sulfonate transport system substrate-binding protein